MLRNFENYFFKLSTPYVLYPLSFHIFVFSYIWGLAFFFFFFLIDRVVSVVSVSAAQMEGVKR